MSEVSMVGLDLAKHVFQVRGANAWPAGAPQAAMPGQVLEPVGQQLRCGDGGLFKLALLRP